MTLVQSSCDSRLDLANGLRNTALLTLGPGVPNSWYLRFSQQQVGTLRIHRDRRRTIAHTIALYFWP